MACRSVNARGACHLDDEPIGATGSNAREIAVDAVLKREVGNGILW